MHGATWIDETPHLPPQECCQLPFLLIATLIAWSWVKEEGVWKGREERWGKRTLAVDDDDTCAENLGHPPVLRIFIGLLSMEEKGRIKKTGHAIVNIVREHSGYSALLVLLQIIVYKCHSHITKAGLRSLAQISLGFSKSLSVNFSMRFWIWPVKGGLAHGFIINKKYLFCKCQEPPLYYEFIKKLW